MRYWVYLKKVLYHKWCVYQEGCALGVSRWNLFWHDWDKFLPFMFVAYARHFYTPDGTPRLRRKDAEYGHSGDIAFDRAWLAHIRRNRHHWDYWVYVQGARVYAAVMPLADLKEMLADWRGAARAYGGDTHTWYLAQRREMTLSPFVRYWIETELGVSEDERMIRSSVFAKYPH